MHYWRSQGVGYIYVAGGIPQIQIVTQTGAAEQQAWPPDCRDLPVVIVGRVS